MPSAEMIKRILTPLGGLNAEDNLTRIPDTQVSSSVNMLYQQMQAQSRPGLSSAEATGVTGPISFVENVVCNAVQYSIYINVAGDLFYVASGIGTGPIAGPGTNFGAVQFQNITSIIGRIVFGNNLDGIVLWDLTVLANPYTIVAAAKYRYICGQQGRAIAAYDTSLPLLLGPRTFAWSAPGDLTVWTSSDGTAGSEAIAEINDEITGLGVLHNIGVIPHRNGIHLAYPTGNLPLPFNVQSFILKGNGIWYPSTVAWSDELMIGVGEDNVYVFDLQSLTPIGNSIRIELMTLLFGGVTYRGVITRYGSSFFPRYRYHLFPIQSPTSPHFCYDIAEKTWSRHIYTDSANWAWNLPSPASSGLGDFGIALVDNSNPPIYKYWDTAVTCEHDASFTKYIGNLESLDTDYQIEDVIIHWQDFGTVIVSITITGTGSAGVTSTTARVTIPGLGDGKWKRFFLSRTTSSLRQVGNDFVAQITYVNGANPFVMDQVTFLLTPQGDYRG